MFHQVGPVGPFDEGTRLVTQRAELAALCGAHHGRKAVLVRGAGVGARIRERVDTGAVAVLSGVDDRGAAVLVAG